MDFSARSLKSQFKVADREGAAFCLVVGESELASQTIVVKDLRTGQQNSVGRAGLIPHLQSLVRA